AGVWGRGGGGGGIQTIYPPQHQPFLGTRNTLNHWYACPPFSPSLLFSFSPSLLFSFFPSLCLWSWRVNFRFRMLERSLPLCSLSLSETCASRHVSVCVCLRV